MAKDIFDTFETALTTLERLTSSLPRLEAYQATFDLDTATALRDPLVNIYGDMLEFCVKAVKLHKRGRMSMVISASLLGY